ncbi:protein containing tetratricopeptide repeats [Hahella chejuensis KCTC 2396]|uniref:Protein containing tetratricopeptide repeats n=1 Tax=Hahella chejuensis (strain KCTC 2396) TaxID=349521 RepID=Q2S865_HAHCH|nr:protein containing tetratricopeptide repeats [Hahella chejuensis KCTC 2396]
MNKRVTLKSVGALRRLRGIAALCALLWAAATFGVEKDVDQQKVLAYVEKLSEIKSPQQALDYWRSLEPELGGTDGRYEYWLGKIYQDLQQNEAALQAFNQSVKLDPGNRWPYLKIAELGIQQGAYEAVESLMNKLINAYPDWYLAPLTLAQSYYASGRYDDAVKAVTTSLKIELTLEGYVLLSKAALETKDYLTVVQAGVTAQESDPQLQQDPELSERIVQALIGMERRDKAAVYLDGQKSALPAETIRALQEKYGLK